MDLKRHWINAHKLPNSRILPIFIGGCGRVNWTPGAQLVINWQVQNSQTPVINGTFRGFCIQGHFDHRGARGFQSHGRMAEISHLFSCWLTHEAQVIYGSLELQVEREGSMDWITLLIPIKLAVFCFFLWYGFNYLWGWNSTSSRDDCPQLRRWMLVQLHPGHDAAHETPKLPYSPQFYFGPFRMN